MNKKRYVDTMFIIASLFPMLLLVTHFEMSKYPILLFVSCIILTVFMTLHFEKMQTFSKILFRCACVYFVINYKSLFYALGNIYNDIIKIYARDSSVHFFEVIIRNKTLLEFNTFLILILYHIGVSYLLKILFEKKKHPQIIILLLLATLPLWIVRVQLYWVLVVLFIGFLLLLVIPVHICEDVVSFKNGIKQSAIIFLTTCILFLNIMSVVTPKKAERWFLENEFFERINDYFMDLIDEWLKGVGTLERIELKDYKDRAYLGKVHGALYSDKQDTFYLKELNGSVYEESAWKALDSKTYKIFDDVSLQKTLRKDVLHSNEELQLYQLQLMDYRVDRSYSLFPYHWANTNVNYINVKDRLIDYEEDKVIFEIHDNLDYTTFKTTSNYDGFVQDYYLQIPEEMVTYLEKTFDLTQYEDLIKKGYYSKKEEVISIVLDILDDCDYTLKPGETPKDKDFVQYFLSDNKKGYSPHFATAATLLLRYFGIPTRYVQGYRVQNTSFQEQGNVYFTNMYDYDEYAWIEIYDEYNGWYPMDVSVGKNIDEIKKPIKPTVIPNEDEIDDTMQDKTENKTEKPIVLKPGTSNNETQEVEKIFSVFYIIYFVLLLPFISVWIRRFFRKRYYKNKDIKNVCFALYRRLEKLERYGEVFTDEILALFEKNRFSEKGIGEEELEIILLYTQNKCKEICKDLTLLKKIKLYFIDCLL